MSAASFVAQRREKSDYAQIDGTDTDMHGYALCATYDAVGSKRLGRDSFATSSATDKRAGRKSEGKHQKKGQS